MEVIRYWIEEFADLITIDQWQALQPDLQHTLIKTVRMPEGQRCLSETDIYDLYKVVCVRLGWEGREIELRSDPLDVVRHVEVLRRWQLDELETMEVFAPYSVKRAREVGRDQFIETPRKNWIPDQGGLKLHVV